MGDNLRSIFSSVNETYPAIGSVGRIMAPFAGSADGYTNNNNADLGLSPDAAPV